MVVAKQNSSRYLLMVARGPSPFREVVLNLVGDQVYLRAVVRAVA